MGKDYRHGKVNRSHFDMDGYDGVHKLQKYDRDKTRKQNKFNMNHLEVVSEETGDDFAGGPDGFVPVTEEMTTEE